MSKGLATALRSGKAECTVHRQQLKATQDFIIEKQPTNPAPEEKQDKDVFPIMKLPYDIRHIVLEHMIEAQTLRAFLKHAATPIQLPEVARAGSSLLRRECLLVALKKSTIEIHSRPGNAALQAWLGKVDFTGVETDGSNCHNGFDAINALCFPYFSRFPYSCPGITTNNDVQLALTCKHLCTLTLNFHPHEIARIESEFLPSRISDDSDEEEEQGAAHIAAAASMRDKYQLDRLLDAKQLRTLCLAAFETCTMKVLAKWFVDEFKERGQRVVVRFV